MENLPPAVVFSADHVAGVTRQFLFNTSPFDPVVWGGAGVLLIAAALIAAGLPAREAGRANPIVALRAGD